MTLKQFLKTHSVPHESHHNDDPSTRSESTDSSDEQEYYDANEYVESLQFYNAKEFPEPVPPDRSTTTRAIMTLDLPDQVPPEQLAHASKI